MSGRGKPPIYPHVGSIGEDEDGALFYAVYKDYSGQVSWKPLEWWRWLRKRRIYRDIIAGDDWYVYQLEKAP